MRAPQRLMLMGRRLPIFDADGLAWRDAVMFNGGSVSNARLAIVSAFIRAEKAAGTWTLTDDYWGFWAENAVQALTSLKQRRLATAVNSPTFTVDRGYSFDGTTQYIDTGFVSNAHAVAMTGTSLRIGVYERANLSISRYAAGSSNSATRNLEIVPRDAGSTIQARLNSNTSATAGVILDSRRFAVAQRSGSTYGAYKDGSPIALSTPGSAGSSLPSFATYIGASNQNGTAASFRACSLGLVCVGAAMSDAQNLAAYNAAQVFATAVGAQV